MNANLSPIERAKQRLAAIKDADIAFKKKLEDELTKHRSITIPSLTQQGWQYDHSMPWNEEQMQAINAGLSGKSFVLIGAAGTGKTTTEKGIVYSMLKNNLLPPIPDASSTKWLHGGKPGIVMTSFTNMAVRQTAKHFSKDVTCVTIHKLLEYAPVWYEVENADGTISKKMLFEPSRHKGNPLPRELKTIIVDEASMVDTDLFQKLWDALPNPHAVQFIFLGDLNQLPPVYGGPILGKKLLELPIIELTQVYRQAMLSPIIRYALQMKDGKPTPVGDKIDIDEKEHGRVIIHPWSGRLKWEDALLKVQNFCKGALKAGVYDPMQDMILCPYNVNFGVIDINLAIADYLGRQREAVVHEVIAGFEKHYFAIGDKLLVQKQEAIITKIVKNPRYAGKHPMSVDKYNITRFGGATLKKNAVQEASSDFDSIDFDVDAYLDGMSTEVVDRKTQASHTITVRFISEEEKLGQPRPMNDDGEEDDGFEHILDTSALINEVLFGYALTVHKSQGSEWRRVFLFTHWSHNKMCSRELMYTAMTRAKSYLYIICEPDRVSVSGTLSAAARKPRLKGNTLAEKLASLKERFEKEAREKAANLGKEIKRKELEDDGE